MIIKEWSFLIVYFQLNDRLVLKSKDRILSVLRSYTFSHDRKLYVWPKSCTFEPNHTLVREDGPFLFFESPTFYQIPSTIEPLDRPLSHRSYFSIQQEYSRNCRIVSLRFCWVAVWLSCHLVTLPNGHVALWSFCQMVRLPICRIAFW